MAANEQRPVLDISEDEEEDVRINVEMAALNITRPHTQVISSEYRLGNCIARLFSILFQFQSIQNLYKKNTILNQQYYFWAYVDT